MSLTDQTTLASDVDADDDERDYIVTLELSVTASSPEEAIRFFLDDANDRAMALTYTVTSDDETERVEYSHDHD
jgi:hypothetical protein